MSKPKPDWFIKIRGSYLPNSWQAWLTYVPFVAYLVFVILDIVRSSLSVKQAFYIAFPQFVCAGIIMTWIATSKSK